MKWLEPWHRGNNALRASSAPLMRRLPPRFEREYLSVIDSPDAVLVADRERSQDVKKIVAALEAQGREEKNLHRKVHRPWG